MFRLDERALGFSSHFFYMFFYRKQIFFRNTQLRRDLSLLYQSKFRLKIDKKKEYANVPDIHSHS